MGRDQKNSDSIYPEDCGVALGERGRVDVVMIFIASHWV